MTLHRDPVALQRSGKALAPAPSSSNKVRPRLSRPEMRRLVHPGLPTELRSRRRPEHCMRFSQNTPLDALHRLASSIRSPRPTRSRKAGHTPRSPGAQKRLRSQFRRRPARVGGTRSRPARAPAPPGETATPSTDSSRPPLHASSHHSAVVGAGTDCCNRTAPAMPNASAARSTTNSAEPRNWGCSLTPAFSSSADVVTGFECDERGRGPSGPRWFVAGGQEGRPSGSKAFG